MEQKGKFTLLNREEFQQWLFSQTISRDIKVIQNHHTWIPNYSHFYGDNHFALLEGMEASHIQRGFGEIAQNLTIFPDGLIAIGRSLDKTPAGIAKRNTGAVCIENLGDFDLNKDQMTIEQHESIIFVNAVLCKKFKLIPSTDSVVYHHWFSPKSCPGTDFFGGNSIESAKVNFIPLVKTELDKIVEIRKVATGQVVNVAIDDVLYVRSGPSAKFDAVGELQNGDTINIFAKRKSWYKISDTEEQWVNGKFIKIF